MLLLSPYVFFVLEMELDMGAEMRGLPGYRRHRRDQWTARAGI